jgi:hypothetical protein
VAFVAIVLQVVLPSEAIFKLVLQILLRYKLTGLYLLDLYIYPYDVRVVLLKLDSLYKNVEKLLLAVFFS